MSNDVLTEKAIAFAVKEASETEYWLELLYRADYLKEKEYTSLINDCSELMKLLTATLNTAKN